MKNNKGQTLYYFLIFVMILVITWAMMLNIAKLIRDRMQMQNMTDNIVLSIATHKARTMNFVGACNYLIGSLLASGTKPEFLQFPTYTTDEVASFQEGDFKGNVIHKAYDNDIALLKKGVDALQKAQELAMIAHLEYHKAQIVEAYSNGKYILKISPTYLNASVENAEKFFGLKRNMKGIKYLKTINTEYSPYPHIVYNPFPLQDILEYIGGKLFKLLEKFGINAKDEIVGALGLGSDALSEKVYKKSEYSWYITADNFADQKIQVALIKNRNDKDRPLFSKFLKIKYPMMTTVSAASIYNTKGTMFPQKESDLIGRADFNKLMYLDMGKQALAFGADLIEVDVTPYKLLSAAVVLYLAARLIHREKMLSKGEADSPIANYNKAKTGGWSSHLVPYRLYKNEEGQEI